MAMEDYVPCDQNMTNRTEDERFTELPDLYKVVAGALIFFFILPFILLNLTVFPIGSTFAVLLGALLMVVFQVVSQDEVYQVVGHRDSLTALFLLLGMLIIAQYFEREQILVKLLRRFLLPSLKFENYLIRVSLIAFLVSIFFTNDVCCTVLTPLLLKVWDAQERARTELETVLLAVMTTANIGAMVTVFSSLQVALISSRTSGAPYENSRLDMRACFMYLLPVAAILAVVNVCFLIIHHRIRTRHIEKSMLISEPSHSEQEMAGLTARENNNGNGQVNVINITSHGFINGYLKAEGRDDLTGYDGVYMGPASTQRSDDRISIPCQLETIPEDDILEISSSQSTSLRDCLEIDSPSPRHYATAEAIAMEMSDSSSSDSDDEGDRMRNTDENLHQLNINYRPGALQSQNLTTIGESCMSLSHSLELHGLQISHRLGVYRSLRAFSTAHFLPHAGLEDRNSVLASDSVIFLVCLCLLTVSTVSLLLAACYTHIFDLGLVPLAAATFAVLTDAVVNRRAAQQLIKRADWSVILLLLGLYVWMQGLHNTRLIPHAWHVLGLRSGSEQEMSLQTLGAVTVFVLAGSTLCGPVPIVLIICDLLEPCVHQRGLVLYLAVLATAGGNLSLYTCTANMMAVQRGVQVLKYRLSFLSHLQYGLLSSVLLLPLGLLLIYGLLLIGVH